MISLTAAKENKLKEAQGIKPHKEWTSHSPKMILMTPMLDYQLSKHSIAHLLPLKSKKTHKQALLLTKIGELSILKKARIASALQDHNIAGEPTD